jgi:hypothetical protein
MKKLLCLFTVVAWCSISFAKDLEGWPKFKSDLRPVLIFVFVATWAVTFIVGMIRRKKRTQAMAAMAQTIGFKFEGSEWCDPSRAERMTTALFEKGHGKRFRNIMTGIFAGFDTSLFDYSFTSGTGEGSKTQTQSVVVFSQDLPLPRFELRPEGLLDVIGNALTHKDIKFSSHPQFSGRYVLRGAEEEKVRELFTPELLTFLEGLPPDYLGPAPEAKWQIEGDRGALVLYRRDLTVAPEEVRPFLEGASSIAKTFFNCCGLKKPADQHSYRA